MSQTFLPDVLVLQVGDFLLPEEEAALKKAKEETVAAPVEGEAEGDAQAAAAQQPESDEGVTPPDVITIVIKPQDAVTLNYLIYSGAKLTLALRGPNDTTRTAINPVTLQYLLDQYMIPVPLRLPYGMEPGVFELKPPESTLDPQPE